MTTSFNAQNPNSANVSMDELEKKIESVNSSMVAARNDAEKYRQLAEDLKGQITSLQQTRKELNDGTVELNEAVASLKSDKEALLTEISKKKAELVSVTQELAEAKRVNGEEFNRLSDMKTSLDKREEEVKNQEATLRVYGKGLEEKEKKLDIYADRVKKLLDAAK